MSRASEAAAQAETLIPQALARLADYIAIPAVSRDAERAAAVRQVVELLMDLDGSSRVLDFGCGTGWTAEPLTGAGAQLGISGTLSVDGALDLIEAASRGLKATL